MRFPLRPLHAIFDIVGCGAALLATYRLSTVPSLWAFPTIAIALYFLYQVTRFPMREFIVNEAGVRQVAPSRRFGLGTVESFRWDEVVRIRAALALETAGNAWLWGAPITIKLEDRYLTLHPEAYGEEAFTTFIEAAEARGLLED